jgi:hypothetical protein
VGTGEFVEEIGCGAAMRTGGLKICYGVLTISLREVVGCVGGVGC